MRPGSGRRANGRGSGVLATLGCAADALSSIHTRTWAKGSSEPLELGAWILRITKRIPHHNDIHYAKILCVCLAQSLPDSLACVQKLDSQ